MTRQIAISVLFLLACPMSTVARAQSTDTNYSLYVPPLMTLTALRGPQFRTHPGTAGNVNMNSSVWYAQTAAPTGSTVTFSTDQAFTNTGNSSYKRDARLRVRRLFGSGGSGWAFETTVDRTDYKNGDEEATVSVSSQTAGVALIMLRVTFLTDDVSTLVGGNYDMTIIGTISEN